MHLMSIFFKNILSIPIRSLFCCHTEMYLPRCLLVLFTCLLQFSLMNSAKEKEERLRLIYLDSRIAKGVEVWSKNVPNGSEQKC